MLSCRKDDFKLKANEGDLVGNWINPEYKDSLMMLEKSAALKPNVYGISFKADGKLVERKIDGWCGTPPVVYKDYEGTWTSQDSFITIEVGYWGGMAVSQWTIISVSGKRLTVIRK